MSQPHALLVAGPASARRSFLTDNLAYDQYTVAITTAQRGTAALAGTRVDAILIDACDDPGAGLRLLTEIRTARHTTIEAGIPVMMLGRSSDIDVLRAFELGADDVLRCPFSYPELRARLCALLRRTHPAQHRTSLRVGELVIDPASRTVSYAHQPVELAAREYELLRALAADPTRVMTKPELMRNIWGHTNTTSRTLDSHACRLRAKLQQAGATGLVVNVWGVGYRLTNTPT